MLYAAGAAMEYYSMRHTLPPDTHVKPEFEEHYIEVRNSPRQ
jgi:hypothetical protein